MFAIRRISSRHLSTPTTFASKCSTISLASSSDPSSSVKKWFLEQKWPLPRQQSSPCPCRERSGGCCVRAGGWKCFDTSQRARGRRRFQRTRRRLLLATRCSTSTGPSRSTPNTLDFTWEQRAVAVFATVSRGQLHLLLSGPGAQARARCRMDAARSPGAGTG